MPPNTQRSNQIVHLIVDQSSLDSGLRNELMNNVVDSLKEWALKVSLVATRKYKVLFSFLKINNQSIIEELIPVDELSLQSMARNMKASSDKDQGFRKYSLSNSLSVLNSFLDNYMVGESESTQIILFTMNQFSKGDAIEEVFRRMYNDNKDLHIVKVIHDFEEDISFDQDVIKCVENYPNIRISSIFNDPICITRELFQSTKHLLKIEISGVRLYFKNEKEPLNLSILSTGSSNCLHVEMKERVCLCHGEKVNSNLFYQTLPRGFICSKTLKMIDTSDTIPALLLRSSTEQVLIQANDESALDTHSESIDIEVMNKVPLSSIPYELLFERSFIMVPFTDISFDIHDLERNEGHIASLCTILSEEKLGLICTSTSNLDGTSIKGSGILYHFIIFPDSQCRCLYIQQLSTSDEILPPVHIPAMMHSEEQRCTMNQKLFDLETVEDFNPLHLSSKKVEFIYKSIKGVGHVRRGKEISKTPIKKVDLKQPNNTNQRINSNPNTVSNNDKKNYKQLVKKIVFK